MRVHPFGAFVVAFLASSLPARPGAGGSSDPFPEESSWIRYRVLPSIEKQPPPVRSIELQVEPGSGTMRGGMRWWRLVVAKDSGEQFVARILSDRVPMTAGWDPDDIRIARYILREGTEEACEYVNVETGRALLPEFEFTRNLLPQPAWNTPPVDGFFTTGTYLGHALTVDEQGTSAVPEDLGPVMCLDLNPGLLIGTGRNQRDINEERLEEGDYTYRKFLPEEYPVMIDAGMNLFRVDPEQEEYIRKRPVFYVRGVKAADTFRYPGELYRSNFAGASQFVDEPAIRLIADTAAYKPAHPWDNAEFLRRRVRYVYSCREDYGIRRLAFQLRSAGFNLGTLDLLEWDVPIWETVYGTAFYQLEAGGSGIIHEGRYRLDEYLDQMKILFHGGGLELTAEEMLLLHIAFLRGAARCTGKDWGISIYGQSDPEINPLAVELAYDLGARYIWFWTSDYRHHLPWREQLELARTVARRAREKPRPPREELLRKAEVAVAFPEGYTYSYYNLWLNPKFNLSQPNHVGVEYREVIATAMFEGILRLKEGVPFDFVVDSPLVDQAGYSKIVRVGYDAEVTTRSSRRRSSR